MPKIMFYELAEGELAKQVQKDFEEAQAITHGRGVKTKVILEVTLHPESRDRRGTAMVEFKSQMKAPPKASIQYVTELNREGQLVDSGARQGNIFNNSETKGGNQ